MICLLSFYENDYFSTTSIMDVSWPLFRLSTITQKSQQSASKVACPCLLYRIASCLSAGEKLYFSKMVTVDQKATSKNLY